jgi:hypothetical protein
MKGGGVLMKGDRVGPPYRYIAALEFAGGLALAGAAKWLAWGDVAILTALALMFYAGRNWQRGGR